MNNALCEQALSVAFNGVRGEGGLEGVSYVVCGYVDLDVRICLYLDPFSSLYLGIFSCLYVGIVSCLYWGIFSCFFS